MENELQPKLRPVERDCLDAYRMAKRKAGMNPTLDEVVEEMGKSKTYVAFLLAELWKKGKLTKNGRKARCYGLPKRAVTQ